MSSITNGIGYSGEIKAYLTKEDNIPVHLHNSGFKALWNTLAMAVTGYDISSHIPKRFGIYARSEGKNDIACLYSHIPFVGIVWGDMVESNNESTSARFTVTVTKKDRALRIQPNQTLVLKMFNSIISNDENDQILAEIEDTDGVLANIHNSMITGVDAVYEWKMTFKNVAVSSESRKN